MRRITAHAAVAVIIGGLLTPVASLAVAAPASADAGGAATLLVGNGRGFSGPASRAMLAGNNPRIDTAPDGSVLTTDDNRVLRVRPDTDTVAIAPGTTVASSDGPILDVAATGTSVVFATPSGVQRAASDGTITRLLTRTGVRALDVGSDGVVWVATPSDVLRILPSGAVLSVTTAASSFGDAIDLTVTPDGSRAYVLDNGDGRFGIYQVTAAGVGVRVAGTLGQDYGAISSSPLGESTALVRSLTTDGTDIVMSVPNQSTKRFHIGGDYVYGPFPGLCNGSVVYRGTQLVVECLPAPSAPHYPTLHAFSVQGTDLGRILGVDPAQPWSPDGVLAADAYTDSVGGAAGLPDGRVVFTTSSGLIREVDTDGRLRTRATLAPYSVSKVALAPDGTAYVLHGTGPGTDGFAIAVGIVKVPVSGPPVLLNVNAQATDVEVQTDGTLVVADARGRRLLRVPADGSGATVLADAVGTPEDIGLDGDTVLVADSGLQRVAADGTVTSVLTGGTPVTAARTSEGIWTDPLIGDLLHRPQVLLPSGALAPVATGLPWWTFAQVQAVGDGDVVVSGSNAVWLVSTGGLPAVAPFAITATSEPGRIDLDWDATGLTDLVMVAKRGSVPPVDRWDGGALGDPHHLRLDGVLPQDWSFAAFARTASGAWSAPATATASALEDTVAPLPPVNPQAVANTRSINLMWTRPSDPDLDHEVVRMALGTTPPATPDDGILVSSRAYSGISVPNPVAGQDYALSIFDVDQHGNYSSWSTVSRLDLTPPGPVTDLQVTPGYRSVTFSVTPPTDPDYAGYRFRVVAGSDTPPLPDGGNETGTSKSITGLTMGTDYTLAVWALDAGGNSADPVVTHFSTLLDNQPPAPIADLSATGGDYLVSATWTPPSDPDLASFTVRFTSDATGTVLASLTLDKSATQHTWSGLPGGNSYTVTVTATDTQGLVSPVATATAQTAADGNGNPPQIAPSTVTVTPASPTTVQVSFPRPDIPDLRTVQAAVAPLGQDPSTATSPRTLSIGTTTVSGTVTLPLAATSYQLVLYVVDLNGHVTRSVGPNVQGGPSGPSAAQLPAAPTAVTASSPGDNTIGLSWSIGEMDAYKVTSWTVTATSGSLSRSVTLTPSSRQTGFDDLEGRQGWTLTVHGNNTFGAGPSVSTGPIPVADSTAPATVSGATATPAADTEALAWVNPTAFDFDHVVVTRLGATPAETQVVYSGAGTSAQATGLLAGHTYSFQIRAFDHLGNVDPAPVTLTSVQSALTLGAPALLNYGSPLTLTGALTWNGTPLAGRAVSIQAQAAGSTVWTPMTTATTTSTGAFSAVIRPSVTLAYRVGFAGSGGTGGAYSPVRVVGVSPTISIASNLASLPLGGTVTISTTLTPRHPGGAILLQRWTGTGWSAVAWRTLSSTSTAAVAVRPPSRGINTYRWVTPSDPSHAAGYGAMRQVRVF